VLTGDGIAALLPASWMYRGGVAVVRALRTPAKPASAVPRVVSVGNLTVGGSGKTPLALWLVERALRAGKSAAYASRGFAGAGERGPWVSWIPAAGASAPSSFAGVRVVARDADIARTVGDEAALVALRAPRASVLVARDKRRAVQVASRLGVDVVVVDDALQSFALPRHIDLILLDARRPFGNGRLLPAGPLREPPSALARADVVVFNGASDADSIARARESVSLWLRAGQRVYGLRREVALVPVTRPASETLRDAVLVAGIARPEDFRAAIEAAGVGASETMEFRDHYRYDDADVRRIHARAGGRPIITTEKDWVKLSRFDWGDRAVWMARLDVDLVGHDDVDAWLLP